MARKPRAEFEITAEDNTRAALASAEAQLSKVAGGVKTFGLAAGAALAGLAALTIKVTNDLDKLAKSAQAAGIGPEVFQAWEFAAGQAGIEVGEFRSAMERATKVIGEAAEGTGSAVKVFDRLNIAVRDSQGNVRSTENVVRELADRLAGMSSQAERAAASAAVFGREGGTKLALLLQGGNDELAKFEQQARDLGIIVSGDTLVAAEKFNDQLDILKKVLDAGLASSLGDLIPVMSELADVTIKAAGGFSKFIVELFRIGPAAEAQGELAESTNALSAALDRYNQVRRRVGDRDLSEVTKGTQREFSDAALLLNQAIERYDKAVGRVREVAAQKAAETPPVGGEGDQGATTPDVSAKQRQKLLAILQQQLDAEEKAEKDSLDRRRLQQQHTRETMVAEEEARVLEDLARAAGFDSVKQQQEAERDAALFAARLGRRQLEHEQELALELGFKDIRDQALLEAEERFQDELIRARFKDVPQFQKLATDLAKFEKSTATQKSQFILGQAQQLTQGLAATSKTAFNINKAAALAEAIVNTAAGITAALRQGPQGIPLAALIGAAGAAQIATIASTQFGGAATGSVSGVGSGIPSQASQSSIGPPPTVSSDERTNAHIRIELVGGDDVSRAVIRNMRVIINDEDETVASSSSRQAIEFAT